MKAYVSREKGGQGSQGSLTCSPQLKEGEGDCEMTVANPVASQLEGDRESDEQRTVNARPRRERP